jgi:hypothetical protein
MNVNVIAFVYTLSRICLEGLRRTSKLLSEDSLCPSKIRTGVPRYHKSKT